VMLSFGIRLIEKMLNPSNSDDARDGEGSNGQCCQKAKKII